MRKISLKTVYNQKSLWYNDNRWREVLYSKAGIKIPFLQKITKKNI